MPAVSGSSDCSRMHPDLYNFHIKSLATTSAALGSSTSSALSLTEPPASLGNHQSCQYSHSWNDGCPLATAGFFTPAKRALGTTLTSTTLTIQQGANGTAPLLCQRGVTTITRSLLLAKSSVHSFDSVLFGSHDNFSAPSVNTFSAAESAKFWSFVEFSGRLSLNTGFSAYSDYIV